MHGKSKSILYCFKTIWITISLLQSKREIKMVIDEIEFLVVKHFENCVNGMSNHLNELRKCIKLNGFTLTEIERMGKCKQRHSYNKTH